MGLATYKPRAAEWSAAQIEELAMSYDPTESLRREMLETNQPHVDLAHAEKRWDTDATSR